MKISTRGRKDRRSARPARAVRSGSAVLGALALGVALTACGSDDGSESADDAADQSESENATSPAPDPSQDAEDEPTDDPPAENDADGEEELPLAPSYAGEEGGGPSVEPERLSLSEFSTMQDLTWEQWDGEQAVGSGMLSGMWCLPECTDDPFEATLTLSDPQEVNGEVYFSTFVLESEEAEAFEPEGVEEGEDFVPEDLSGERPLAVPSS